LAAPVVLVTLAALAIPAAQVVAGTDGALARICNIKSIESVTGSSGLSYSLAVSDSGDEAGPESPAAEASAGDVEPKDFWSGLIVPGPQKDEGDADHDSTWTWVADVEPHIDHEELARAQVEGLAEAAADMRREAEQFKSSDPARARQMQAAADRLTAEARVAEKNAAEHARHAEAMQVHAQAMAVQAEVMGRKAAERAIDVDAIQKHAEKEARKAEKIARRIEMKFRNVEFNQDWDIPEPPAPPAAPAMSDLPVPPAPPAPPALNAPTAPPAPPAPPKPLAAAVSSVIVRTKVAALPNGKIAVNVETMGRQPNALPAVTLNVLPAAKPSAIPAPKSGTDIVINVERKVQAG
jgi:hypothetical protein